MLPEALAMLKGMNAEEWPPEVRAGYAKQSPDGAGHWPIVFDRIRTMWLTEPSYATKELAAITAPTLVVAGDHDLVKTAHTVELATSIPNAQLAILPGASHEVVIEDPARWSDVVLAFLTAPAPTGAKAQ